MKRLCVFLATALLVAACGGGDQGANGVLHRALAAEPESLDLHKARSTQAAEVLRDIGEGLVSFSPQGELVPGVAERWSVADDGLTYTFTLREDARWSNGEPLVAQHFVTAFERLAAPETAAFYAAFLESVVEVGALDEHTLVLVLDQPTPYLMSLLTHPATFPVYPPALAEHGDAWARPGTLVGNGAYRLEAWVPGSVITLVRNPHYWNDDETSIDSVKYHTITQEAAELSRYRAGELHITSTVPSEAFETVRENFADALRVAPSLGVYYYGFNLTRPPFANNPKLRQALSMAIDREELVKNVTRRGEAPAYSWVPPGVNDYQPPRLSYAPLSQAERERLARRLYEEAGYSAGNPLELELRYNTSDTHQRIAVAIQGMWRDVLGVETQLINEEFQVLLANMRAREVTQAFRSSWTGDYNDAHTFLALLETHNALNLPGYSNPDYDARMASAAAQVEPKRRRGYLEEAERILLDDHPVMPIYFFVSKHLVHPDVAGWGDNVLDYHYSQHLSLEAAD